MEFTRVVGVVLRDERRVFAERETSIRDVAFGGDGSVTGVEAVEKRARGDRNSEFTGGHGTESEVIRGSHGYRGE